MPTDIILVIIAMTLIALALRLVAGAIFGLTHRAGHWGIRQVSALQMPGALRTPLQRGVERWPGPFAFLSARFATDRFSGLPLTLMLIVAVFVIMLLAGLVEEAFESTELLAVDERLMALIAPLRTEAVLSVFVWLTALGNQETLTAVLIVSTAMLAVHGPQRYILPLWIAVIGAQAMSTLGKFVVARPRPDFLVEIDINTYSFPSGHSTSAFSLYLLLAYALTRDLRVGWARFEIWFWSIMIAATIAVSRVIIGVHYPSDIVAGSLLGLFWLGLAIAVAEMIKEVRPRDAGAHPTSDTPPRAEGPRP